MPHESYAFSADIRSALGQSGRAHLALTYLDSNDTTILTDTSDESVTGTSPWSALSLISVAPEDAETVRVELRLSGQGDAWFDDAILETLSRANRLPNSSFEYGDASPMAVDRWRPMQESLTAQTVTNAGFETGTSTAITGWVSTFWRGTSVRTRDTTVAHSGSASAKIVNTGLETLGGWLANPAANVTALSSYRYEVWVKTGTITDGAYMDLIFRNSGGTTVKEYLAPKVTASDQDWTLYSVDYTTPVGSTNVRVDLRLAGAGEVWFDDFSISRIDLVDATGTNSTWSNDFATGAKSAAITSSDSTTRLWLSDPVRVIAGQQYESSIKYRGDTLSGRAFVSLRFLDPSGGVVSVNNGLDLATSGGWTSSGHSAVVPLEASSAQFAIVLAGSGAVTVDDAFLSTATFNLVSNPGAETPAPYVGTGQPEGWSPSQWRAASGVTSSWDNTSSRSGAFSLKVVNSDPLSIGGWVSSRVPVTSGERYSVSGWVKTTSAAGTGGYINAVVFNSASATVAESSSTKVTGTSDWTRVTVTVDVPSNAGASPTLRVDGRLAGTGSAWVDNVEVVHVHPTSTTLTPADRAELRDRALNVEPYSSTYDAWYSIANADRTADPQQAKLAEYSPWRTISHIVTVPANAVDVRIDVRAYGQGSVWFDGVSMEKTTNGVFAPLLNGGFESADPGNATQPASWTRSLWRGTGTAALDVTKGRNSSSSVKIVNTSTDAIQGFVSPRIPVVAGERYTFTAVASVLDATVEKAQINLVFRRADTTVVQELQSPTVTPRTETLYIDHMAIEQYEALAATVLSGANASEFAARSVARMQYEMTDMKRGVKLALRRNTHDSSIYGGHQVGRALQAFAINFDLISAYNSAAVSERDRRTVQNDLTWFAAELMNTRYFDFSNVEYRHGNGNPDRVAGLGMVAMLFPGFSSSQRWVTYATGEVGWYLDHAVSADGSIPETSRYHGGTLRGLTPFAYALKARTGVDLFTEPAFAAMFKFLVDTQTPPDSQHTFAGANAVLKPGIGDANWDPIFFSVLGMAASGFAASNAQLSEELMWTWEAAKKPFFAENQQGQYLAHFALIDVDLPSTAPVLASKQFEDIGYSIFRNNAGNDYMVLRANPTITFHNHWDVGSFSIYHDGTPLSLDSGVRSYVGSYSDWFSQPQAHNNVIFKDSVTGAPFTSPTTGQTSDFYTGANLDSVRVTIPWSPASGVSRYERQLAYAKAGLDFYVLWDSIDSTSPSESRIHSLSESVAVSQRAVVADALGGKELRYSYLLPSSGSLSTGVGGIGGFYSLANQNHTILQAGAGEDYLVVLEGADDTADDLETAALVASGDVVAFVVTTAGGARALVVANRGAAQDSVIEFDADITDLRDSASLESVAGEVEVAMPANGLRVFLVND